MKDKRYYELKYDDTVVRYEVINTLFPNSSRKFFGIVVRISENN